MPPRTASSDDTKRSGRVAAAGGAVALGIALLAAATAQAAHPAGGAASSRTTGGATFAPRPEIAKVVCIRSCASRGRLRAGSTMRITGRRLAPVTRVVFHGAGGTADDVAVRVRPASARTIKLQVPAGAPSGPLSAWAGRYVRSLRTRPLAILPPPPPVVKPELTPVPGPREPGGPQLETGTSGGTVFFGAERGVTFSYRVADEGPVSVQVELVRAADGSVIRSWAPRPMQPGQVGSVAWNGMAGGKVQPEGRYSFRLLARGFGGARARSAQVPNLRRDAFDFYRHIFPVRGRHDYGQSGARFGAGRAGHSHQGHDVFARCGTKLVAARGGVVKFTQYHSAAGYYLVIDGARTTVDYAYMHLQRPSPFKPGDRIYTGQQIGAVGESGNARGCHLHFELWDGPGWYDGGRPFDPLPYLHAWDSFS